MAEVVGLEHIYLTVSDLERSEAFYDRLMNVLGFRKNSFVIGDEKHINYFNRHFGFVLRPARTNTPHDPYAPGLHHLCLRVETDGDVRDAAAYLAEAGISVSTPKYYPEYAPDYFACFLEDPDGIRLEIANFRADRRERHEHWERGKG